MPAQRAQGIRDVHLIILFIDGLPAWLFDALLEEGRLPNIEKYLVRRGAYVKNALSLFPTTTFSTQIAAVTGLYPGHYSVPGIRWFDRYRKKERNYLGPDFLKLEDDLALYSPLLYSWDALLERPETLFGRLLGQPTISVQELITRGATRRHFFTFKLALGKLHVWMPHLADQAVVNAIKRSFERNGPKPRLVFACLPDFDSKAHIKRPDSEECRKAMEKIDRQIGEIVLTLKRAGVFDRTYFFLTSDHGNTPVERGNVANYTRLLAELGLKPKNATPGPFRSVASCHCLNSLAIYLPAADGRWARRPDYKSLREFPARYGRKVDVIRALVDHEGTDYIIVRDQNKRIRIVGRNAELIISRRIFLGAAYYQVKVAPSSRDPLRYKDNPRLREMILSERFFPAAKWLNASLTTDYPDAIVQACQIMDSFRAGDIMVCLKPGWKARSSRYKATHGSMYLSDLRIPLVLAGPDITRCEIPVARLVDIYPTALRVLGLKVPFDRIDGRPINQALPRSLRALDDQRERERALTGTLLCKLWKIAGTEGRPSSKTARALAQLLAEAPEGWESIYARVNEALKKINRAMADDGLSPRARRLVIDLLSSREQELLRTAEWLDFLRQNARKNSSMAPESMQ